MSIPIRNHSSEEPEDSNTNSQVAAAPPAEPTQMQQRPGTVMLLSTLYRMVGLTMAAHQTTLPPLASLPLWPTAPLSQPAPPAPQSPSLPDQLSAMMVQMVAVVAAMAQQTEAASAVSAASAASAANAVSAANTASAANAASASTNAAAAALAHAHASRAYTHGHMHAHAYRPPPMPTGGYGTVRAKPRAPSSFAPEQSNDVPHGLPSPETMQRGRYTDTEHPSAEHTPQKKQRKNVKRTWADDQEILDHWLELRGLPPDPRSKKNKSGNEEKIDIHEDDGDGDDEKDDDKENNSHVHVHMMQPPTPQEPPHRSVNGPVSASVAPETEGELRVTKRKREGSECAQDNEAIAQGMATSGRSVLGAPSLPRVKREDDEDEEWR